MGKGDTGKSRDDDCNGFPYLPAPAAKKSREGHPKIDDSHDGECARSGSYRRGGEFDECFQVPSSIRPLSAFFAILTQENQIAKSRFLRLRALHASLRKWVGFSAKSCYDKVDIYIKCRCLAPRGHGHL